MKKSPALTKSPDWPHFIIKSMADGVITVDGEMRVTDLNRAAEKLTGLNREEALHRYCGEVLRSSLCGKECPLRTAMASGDIVSREAILQNHSGRKIEVMLSATALRDDRGQLLGGVETFRDIGPFKAMERERRRLVGMFAHDLKSPVVAVAGLLNRLLRGKEGDLNEGQAASTNIIYQEILRLEKLISNFLDFTRLDLHLITPLLSAVQVEKECQEVLNRLAPRAEAKGITLQAIFPQAMVVLQADSLLLQRALENLLDNAIKYSPPSSRVLLQVRESPQEVQFSIQDEGPGIAPPDQPHLFEILYRGQSAGAETGLGLGLAIVKRIIEAHGGHIWVESEKGRGATFYFTLPYFASPQMES
jgi:PAS domain S-box-containing protein